MEPTKGTEKAYEITEVGRVVYDKFDEGLRFIVMRGPVAWCAYVGVPLDHPLAGFSYDDLPSVEAHGGLTFASEGGREGSWPKGYYWYGWDYAHAGDRTVSDYRMSLEKPNDPLWKLDEKDKDWTIDEVVKDSWSTLYDFKKLVKFAEKIKNPSLITPAPEA